MNNGRMSIVESRLVAELEATRALFIEATGGSHPHLDSLLDPVQRDGPATLNFLAASASGTLWDHEFSSEAGHREPVDGFQECNRRYRAHLARAWALASELGLPSARDRGPAT